MGALKACFFIITPSFNQADFLSRAIDSVLSQTKVEVHYGIFDGGSTDGSLSVLKKYSKKIHWVSEKDNGQTDAINKGLQWIRKTSRNPEKQSFFAYLNADDYYLHPEVLFQVARSFRSQPNRMWLVGDAKIVDVNEKEIQHAIRLYKSFFRTVLGGESLQFLNPFPQPSTFFRYQAIEQIGEFNEELRYTMDYEYWLRAYQKFGQPIFLNQPLSAFRIHKLSKGGSNFDKQFKEEIYVAQNLGAKGVQIQLHKLHAWMTVAAYRFLK